MRILFKGRKKNGLRKGEYGLELGTAEGSEGVVQKLARGGEVPSVPRISKDLGPAHHSSERIKPPSLHTSS